MCTAVLVVLVVSVLVVVVALVMVAVVMVKVPSGVDVCPGCGSAADTPLAASPRLQLRNGQAGAARPVPHRGESQHPHPENPESEREKERDLSQHPVGNP